MSHSFQPYPNEMLTTSPFNIKNEPALLTVGDENKANTMTVSWFGMGVLWDKDVGFVFVRGSRYTKEFLDEYDTFSITHFAPNKINSHLIKYIGTVSGRDEDKINNAKFHLGFFEGTPYIDEGRDVVIMKKLYVTKLEKSDFIDNSLMEEFYSDEDYHYMYVGEVIRLMSR